MLRGLRRFASEAAYLAGASGRMQRDVENITAIRRPVAITRLIGVLSPVREGGTSTVAALLTDAFASQRSDRVLAVDADPVQTELSRRLELPTASAATVRAELVRCSGTADSLREALGGSHGVSARSFGVVVVDCPGGMSSEISAYVGSTGHAFVVSIPSAEQAATHCLAEFDRMPLEGRQLLVSRSVIAVCVVRPGDTDRIQWLLTGLRDRGLRSVVLPYDDQLAGTWPVRAAELRSASRRAALELGARVIERCT